MIAESWPSDIRDLLHSRTTTTDATPHLFHFHHQNFHQTIIPGTPHPGQKVPKLNNDNNIVGVVKLDELSYSPHRNRPYTIPPSLVPEHSFCIAYAPPVPTAKSRCAKEFTPRRVPCVRHVPRQIDDAAAMGADPPGAVIIGGAMEGLRSGRSRCARRTRR